MGICGYFALPDFARSSDCARRGRREGIFPIKQADKGFAIEYYFEHLLKDKGINRDDYLRTMDYFLLFEYCEWIMLGNKYDDAKSERFKAYSIKVKELVKSKDY